MSAARSASCSLQSPRCPVVEGGLARSPMIRLVSVILVGVFLLAAVVGSVWLAEADVMMTAELPVGSFVLPTPTLYPTQVGVHYSVLGAGGDVKRIRSRKNVDNFASEPGGYFGAAFGILRELARRSWPASV